MRPLLATTLAACFAAPLLAQRGIHPDELELKPEIDVAIARGVEALIDGQFRDGTWGQWGRYRGGKTALCVYALLKCGVDADHPTVRRALLFLEPIRPTETYTAACMMLAFGAAGQDRYEQQLAQLAELLIDWQRGGGDYAYPTGAADLSNTQYAALGLWIAQQHGIKVPTAVWSDLIDSVLDYAERPTRVEAPATGEHTVADGGMIEIAGFGYRRGQKPTGSMTTAGVSILQICKIGLGSRLGGQRREVDRAIDAGVNWLGHHFAVDKNPGKGDWVYYYLYGLERVGSLTRLEQIGGHWWFVEGARHLLAKQTKNGLWPGNADQKEVRTAFALLFLRRATSGNAATTGGAGPRVGGDHVFAAGTPKDDAAIGAAGQQPLAVWVHGFGDALLARHRQYGLRIVDVVYLEGERVLGQVAGDPTVAWQSDAFLFRIDALRRGVHEIRARIRLVAPEVPTGETTKTETVLSPVMKVTIRDVFAPWMADAAAIARANIVPLADTEVTASSAEKTAKDACDGKESTHWVCDAKDGDPVLTIDLGRGVSAKHLMISQAGSRATDIGLFDRITVVEVGINKSKPVRVELDPDQLAITTFSFGKTRQVRHIELRIVERQPGRRRGEAGFTEIALSK